MINEFPWEQSLFFCPECKNYWFREGIQGEDQTFKYKFWRISKNGDFLDEEHPQIADNYYQLIKKSVKVAEKHNQKERYHQFYIKDD